MDAIGAFYLGTPGIYLGHTREAAWGLTNHTASGRDLYAEHFKEGGPSLYLEEGKWIEFKIEKQEIPIRGEAADLLAIRRTVRGPVVNEFVTPVAEGGDPPLSLRWVGVEQINGFEAMLELMRAASVEEVLASLEKWPFPNLNFVFADADGCIGYHAVGTVPRRRSPWRGFRSAENPEHCWNGAWNFDELPQLVDPERDWVATANNPPWRGEGAYTALGNWSDGYRFRRIREQIEAQKKLDMAGVAAIQADVQHARARQLGPALAERVRQSDDEEIRALARILEGWDGSYDVENQAPALFEAFWSRWLERLARVHFPERLVALAAPRAGMVACRLLLGEKMDWFPQGTDVAAEIQAVLQEALGWLRGAVGGSPEDWRWGRLHQVRFPHPLGGESSALTELLCPGPFPTSGGTGTVRAAGFSTTTPFAMTSGSTYRMVVDLASPERAWSTTTGGGSGHPASPHYADQTRLWLEDRYHPLNMDVEEADIEGSLELRPVY